MLKPLLGPPNYCLTYLKYPQLKDHKGSIIGPFLIPLKGSLRTMRAPFKGHKGVLVQLDIAAWVGKDSKHEYFGGLHAWKSLGSVVTKT